MTQSVFRPAGCTLSLPVAPVKCAPTARVWPNGNFSLGVTRDVARTPELLWGEADYELPDWVLIDGAAGSEATLTSSNALISHKGLKRRRKGLAGITSMGQQVLRSAAFLAERDYGKADLCFATLTLPTLPQDARRRLQENWSTLLNRLVQFVLRKLESAGRPAKVFGCVEVQSQRLEKYGEGYLHLHAVWPSHSNAPGRRWAVEWEEIRAWWKGAVERFADVKLSGFPRVELSPVRKSAERYLGKYLSKGGGLIEDFISREGEDSCPTAWWFCSRAMRSQVEEESVSGEQAGIIVDALIQSALEDCDLSAFEWIRHVDVKIGSRLVTIGWCGRLKQSEVADIRSLLQVP